MPEQLPGTFYDYPRYYDLVYGSDWKAERDFLVAVFQKHVGHPVETIFEPACGTGRLLFRLARAGYQVSGLDLKPAMVDYCNRRLERHGFGTPAWVGDMCDFEVSRPVDAAFNTINSFRHILDHRQAISHLRMVARSLVPGGIYVLGLHLTPTEQAPVDNESWSARRGHLAVRASIWLTERDLAGRREDYGMTYDIWTPTAHRQVEDRFSFRTYTLDQFLDLIRQSGVFQVDASYDFQYDPDQPIELDGGSEDVVFILART